MEQQDYKIIRYNGQELKTKLFYDLTDDEFNSVRDEYYRKPNYTDVQNQFFQLKEFGMKNDLLKKYYVKDLISKTKLYHCKWSVEDVFNNKELLGYFYARILSNEKLFSPNDSLMTNLEKAFQLGGKGIAERPTNFPLYIVDDILEQYMQPF